MQRYGINIFQDRVGLVLVIASNDGGERGLPTVDGVTAPWSLEHIAKKAIEVGSNPVVGILVDALENAGYAKGAGHFLTGISLLGDSYHYFVFQDINSQIYKLTFWSSAIPLLWPLFVTVVFIAGFIPILIFTANSDSFFLR